MRTDWEASLVGCWWCGAGGEELVARLVVKLDFSSFFVIFGRLGHEKSFQIAKSAQTKEKIEKYQKDDQKVEGILSVLGSKSDKK